MLAGGDPTGAVRRLGDRSPRAGTTWPVDVVGPAAATRSVPGGDAVPALVLVRRSGSVPSAAAAVGLRWPGRLVRGGACGQGRPLLGDCLSTYRPDRSSAISLPQPSTGGMRILERSDPLEDCAAADVRQHRGGVRRVRRGSRERPSRLTLLGQMPAGRRGGRSMTSAHVGVKLRPVTSGDHPPAWRLTAGTGARAGAGTAPPGSHHHVEAPVPGETTAQAATAATAGLAGR